MPRKKRITIEADEWTKEKTECAKLFAVAWTVPEDKAIEYSGVSSWMLETWVKKGYIEKADTSKACFYKPTEYGERHFEAVTGNRCYKSNESSWKHNYKLLDTYYSKSDEEKESWKTEADLKRYALENDWDMKKMSTTDGAYLDSETGEWQCVEIVTKHYKEEHIEKKKVFVEHFGGNYESIKC